MQFENFHDSFIDKKCLIIRQKRSNNVKKGQLIEDTYQKKYFLL